VQAESAGTLARVRIPSSPVIERDRKREREREKESKKEKERERKM